MRTVVVGAGMVGQNLAEALYRQGYNVTLIDQKASALDRAAESLDIQTLRGHGADAEVLAEAGVPGTEFFMAVTDVDEINLLACLVAKEMGALLTVARVTNRVYLGGRRALYRNLMGVDIVVSPEILTAIEIAKNARAAGVVAVDTLTGGRAMLKEVRIPEGKDDGVSIQDRSLPDGALVSLILRNGSALIPSGTDALHADDEVFVLGSTDAAAGAAKRLGPEIGRVTRAIVVGGGTMGRLSAQHLADLDVDVRLIERSATLCHDLSDQLKKGSVLCGDGTDMNLLREAGIESIDLFVAAAGEDELNLIMGMLAGELGAKKRVVIAKRKDFEPIVKRLGIDAAFSPRMLTAQTIMRYIRRPKFTSLATIGDNAAEILDTVVTASSPIVGKPVSELALPKGALLGAILRGPDVIIPRGDTELVAGDNVIVFADSEAIPQLEGRF